MANPPRDDDLSEFWPDLEELEHQVGSAGGGGEKPNGADDSGWAEPDMGILRQRRRDPPRLPIEVFDDQWGLWISEAGRAAAAPADYVVGPLLSLSSTLVGNARWAQGGPGWIEPPHQWNGGVGDSGDGKSPAADCLMRDVVPELERRMVGDFPERHQQWLQTVAFDQATLKAWEKEQQAALKARKSFDKPMPRPLAPDVEPQKPCLRQTDITPEEVAAQLATAAPKGVVITRDELAGFLYGMNAYNPSGRPFWLEAYGGRPYRVARRRHSGQPIEIPRLAVALCGGTQPEKLAQLSSGPDDGLLARINWIWPDPIPFSLGRETPRVRWAIEALDRLRELDLKPGDPPTPILIPLTDEGQKLLEQFGREMQERRKDAGGLLRSAYGKARGTALRLSLVLEWLWWCGEGGMALPPDKITPRAFAAAATLVADYYMPMAERVYGDAAATETERAAATLARWIIRERPPEVYVRRLQRDVRLPGLRTAEQIKTAADALVEADWLRSPAKTVFGQPRGKVAYPVNPKLY